MPQNDRLFQLLSQMEILELEKLWILLKKSPDESFNNSSKQNQVTLISKELRSVSGHSLFNIFRDEHELSWKQILIDVADKLKPGIGWTHYTVNDIHTEIEIEETILRYLDDKLKSTWENSSQIDKNYLALNLTTMLQQTLEEDSKQKRTTNKIAVQTITTQILGNSISSGLFIGGGLRMLVSPTSIGVVGTALGTHFLSQLGVWIVVQLFGWWAGLKLIIGGGAAKLGAAAIGTPLMIINIANTAMAPSYSKSIPVVISILISKNFREVEF